MDGESQHSTTSGAYQLFLRFIVSEELSRSSWLICLLENSLHFMKCRLDQVQSRICLKAMYRDRRFNSIRIVYEGRAVGGVDRMQ